MLAQSLAIMEYLDEKYPEPALLPSDPLGRAYVRSLAQIIGCDIHPLNNTRVLKWLGARWEFTEDEVNEWYAALDRRGDALVRGDAQPAQALRHILSWAKA